MITAGVAPETRRRPPVVPTTPDRARPPCLPVLARCSASSSLNRSPKRLYAVGESLGESPVTMNLTLSGRKETQSRRQQPTTAGFLGAQRGHSSGVAGEVVIVMGPTDVLDPHQRIALGVAALSRSGRQG